jgi:hypothetical protein
MNTTTMFYVGIDVSKDKSDICIKDQNGNDLIQRFKIKNSKADLGHCRYASSLVTISLILKKK